MLGGFRFLHKELLLELAIKRILQKVDVYRACDFSGGGHGWKRAKYDRMHCEGGFAVAWRRICKQLPLASPAPSSPPAPAPAKYRTAAGLPQPNTDCSGCPRYHRRLQLHLGRNSEMKTEQVHFCQSLTIVLGWPLIRKNYHQPFHWRTGLDLPPAR